VHGLTVENSNLYKDRDNRRSSAVTTLPTRSVHGYADASYWGAAILAAAALAVLGIAPCGARLLDLAWSGLMAASSS